VSINKIQVLVVENEEVNAQVARAMLERLGCQVDLAAHGAKAIELFGKENIRPNFHGLATACHGRFGSYREDPQDGARPYDSHRRHQRLESAGWSALRPA